MTIPEITKKYLQGRSLAEFAAGLGTYISRQSVQYWKIGKNRPYKKTLLLIQESPKAQPWAKQFAAECLSILQGGDK